MGRGILILTIRSQRIPPQKRVHRLLHGALEQGSGIGGGLFDGGRLPANRITTCETESFPQIGGRCLLRCQASFERTGSGDDLHRAFKIFDVSFG
jgi:hypothetical protein